VIKTLFTLSSFANILGGAVLGAMWAGSALTDPPHRVPPVVLTIGGSMVIQGLYSLGYSLGWWRAWGGVASGALLAGQLIMGCVGLRLLVMGIFYNERAANGGIEPGPVLAALMIGVNALLALVLLATSGVLTPKMRVRAGP
jgi:hypothetical protein